MEVAINKHRGRIAHGHGRNGEFRNSLGLTLIELLTVIAIIAIGLGIGLPSVASVIQTNRMATSINTLSASFALARSEAITRNQEIVVCKSRDGMNCTNKGGWEQGWIIFGDRNGNERRDQDEERFRVQDALPPGIEVSFSAFRSKHYVHYWASGFTNMNGTFIFCQKNSLEHPKGLILSKVGRLRKSKTRWDGTPLECE